MGTLTGKTIVLGVSGGIAAYKAAELIRLLTAREATVKVMMTRNAWIHYPADAADLKRQSGRH